MYIYIYMNIYHREMRYHDIVPGISFGISLQVLVSGRWLTSYVGVAQAAMSPVEHPTPRRFGKFPDVFFFSFVVKDFDTRVSEDLCVYIYILLSISHNCP